jgi:hypothetical protein
MRPAAELDAEKTVGSLQAMCGCGLKEIIPIGGGMASFETVAFSVPVPAASV